MVALYTVTIAEGITTASSTEIIITDYMDVNDDGVLVFKKDTTGFLHTPVSPSAGSTSWDISSINSMVSGDKFQIGYYSPDSNEPTLKTVTFNGDNTAFAASVQAVLRDIHNNTVTATMNGTTLEVRNFVENIAGSVMVFQATRAEYPHKVENGSGAWAITLDVPSMTNGAVFEVGYEQRVSIAGVYYPLTSGLREVTWHTAATKGTQAVLFNETISNTTATGLDAGTTYTATVSVDGTDRSVSILGSSAATIADLITQLNTDTTGATWSIVQGKLLATSATTGSSSTISIVDSGTNKLFES
jgi:hypothetical protein